MCSILARLWLLVFVVLVYITAFVQAGGPDLVGIGITIGTVLAFFVLFKELWFELKEK